MSAKAVSLGSRIVSGILVILFLACTDGVGTDNELNPPNGCPERIDSTSRERAREWSACEEAFVRNRAELRRLDVATGGFVEGKSRYWFSAGQVDSLRPLTDWAASSAAEGGSGTIGKMEHPVASLYTTLPSEFCSEDTGGVVAQACARLLLARFDSSTGLPLEVHVRWEAPPYIDVDGITDWLLDSADWMAAPR